MHFVCFWPFFVQKFLDVLRKRKLNKSAKAKIAKNGIPHEKLAEKWQKGVIWDSGKSMELIEKIRT